MKHVVIAPFDDDPEPLFAGIREFPTEKLVLITPHYNQDKAEKAKKDFEKFKIPVEIETMDDEHSLEEMFGIISKIKARERGKQLLINLSTAAGMMSCSALSAAFVNGLKAFEIMDEKLIMFPILKFSYYDILSDRKMELLSLLNTEGTIMSLEELSKKVKLGPSLINYHIYGDEKNPGLKELGLVESNREKGKVSISLSTLGKLLLKEKTFNKEKKFNSEAGSKEKETIKTKFKEKLIVTTAK